MSSHSSSALSTCSPLCGTSPGLRESHYLPAKMTAVGQDRSFQPFTGTPALQEPTLLSSLNAWHFLTWFRDRKVFDDSFVCSTSELRGRGVIWKASLKGELCLSSQSTHCGEMVCLWFHSSDWNVERMPGCGNEIRKTRRAFQRDRWVKGRKHSVLGL